MSGPLHFTYDDPERATDITLSLPWARSLVVFAHDYLGISDEPAPNGGVVARFATRDQYSAVRRIAAGVVAMLQSQGFRTEVLIDDNRLVDRSAAARAGVGWIGKSTMLLSPGHGPWLLIGSVATDAELAVTKPMVRNCGTCVACIPACPTGAITDTGLDAAKCISTWLQTSGPIPRWIRTSIGRRIYGCDDCLTSCPPGFPVMDRTDSGNIEYPFSELLGLTDDELVDHFNWFYIPHREPRFLRRNLLVAAGNSQETEAVKPILDHFTHRSSLVRGHAYWALARSLGSEAWTLLRSRHAYESVPDALDELEYALSMAREPNGS
jgi:epoxyqueuosine reductase